QRLVRKLCPRCRKPDETGRSMRAAGCEHCSHSGYVGRTGIYELIGIDEPLQALIHNGANDLEIRRAAEADGMASMRADAMRWVAAGVTSEEEVLRVTRE
ncbi:MAG TPA: type II secretion system protein GspE, partial [Burkholderiaceae bacterium]